MDKPKVLLQKRYISRELERLLNLPDDSLFMVLNFDDGIIIEFMGCTRRSKHIMGSITIKFEDLYLGLNEFSDRFLAPLVKHHG